MPPNLLLNALDSYTSQSKRHDSNDDDESAENRSIKTEDSHRNHAEHSVEKCLQTLVRVMVFNHWDGLTCAVSISELTIFMINVW